MSALPVGKIRRLQQCAAPGGQLVILAIDHRNNLRRSLNPADPAAVRDDELIEFKRQVVASLGPAASAVLIDAEFGAAPVVESGALPGATGLILALERTGYSGDPAARVSELLPGWDPQRAARTGANGVKLLVYYHPAAPTAPQIEDLVRRVAADCAAAEIPLFLEPLSYSLDPGRPLAPDERRRVVLETARRLTAIPGVDVLKAEFPLNVAAVPTRAKWRAACRELTAASRVPWVLLSAGVDFETYLHQVEAAAQSGASGVAVGRAIWKEAVELGTPERGAFLDSAAWERMEQLTALCRALARPWNEEVRDA